MLQIRTSQVDVAAALLAGAAGAVPLHVGTSVAAPHVLMMSEKYCIAAHPPMDKTTHSESAIRSRTDSSPQIILGFCALAVEQNVCH